MSVDDGTHAMLNTEIRQPGDDRRVRRLWAAGAAMGAVLALSGCVQAVRPAEPSTDMLLTRQAQLTLPPPWTTTPTTMPVPKPTLQPSPTPVPKPTLQPSPSPALSASGPWLLYCDRDDEAALMDPAGPGRRSLHMPCLSPAQVSGHAGVAAKGMNIIQFPSGDIVRKPQAGFSSWSADGRLALLAGEWQQGAGMSLVVYDVAADRLRQVPHSEIELTLP